MAASAPAGDLQASLISDNGTLADGAQVLPKQVIVKTWRIKNTGATWPEGVTLQYAGPPFNPMIDGAMFQVHSVATDEEADIAAVMKAPDTAGEYNAVWSLRDASGRPFGPDLVCRVVVAGDAMDVDESDGSWEHVGEGQQGEGEQGQDGDQVPVVSSVLADEGRVARPQTAYQYQAQLDEIRRMGFHDDQLVRQLLEQHNGQVDVVVSTIVQLMQ